MIDRLGCLLGLKRLDYFLVYERFKLCLGRILLDIIGNMFRLKKI